MGKNIKKKRNENLIQSHTSIMNSKILLFLGIIIVILATSHYFFAERNENYKDLHKTSLTQTQQPNFSIIKRYELPHSSLAYT